MVCLSICIESSTSEKNDLLGESGQGSQKFQKEQKIVRKDAGLLVLLEDLKHLKSKSGESTESIGETWGIYDGLIACSLEVLGGCGVGSDQLKRFRV